MWWANDLSRWSTNGNDVASQENRNILISRNCNSCYSIDKFVGERESMCISELFLLF